LDAAETRVRTAEEATEAMRNDLDAARMAQAEAEVDATELREAHARELAVAEHDAKAARQNAEELRQADEARKGQGRWARLRAAWRGG
jgi:hypothetical protein